MPKVSVIIPIYGVEKYIERCARSLFEQTLDDIEFIFVDDCTPDGSIAVLEKVIENYPNRSEQIRILHHEANEGLPIARQTGLRAARGEYIAHCDSDDWVDLDLYEKVYNMAVENSSDVVAFDCKYTDGVNILHETSGGHLTDVKDCINAMMHRKMWWSLCNKIIKHELYVHNDINYPKDGMGEDMCLSLQLMYYCKRISYCHKAYYYYYQNPCSIIQTQTEDKCVTKFNQICRNVDLINQFYCRKGIKEKFSKGINYLEYNAKFPLVPALSDANCRKLWKNKYKGCERNVLFDSDALTKERVRALLIILGLYPSAF